MRIRTCAECGLAFESTRYRVTCSAPCARTRRQRQWRDAEANQSDESRAKDRARRVTPEARAAHALREQMRRRAGLVPPRAKYADLSDDERRAALTYQRKWWRSSPAAAGIAERRNERNRVDNLPADVVADRRRKKSLEQRERRRRRALLDTQVIHGRIDDDLPQ